VDNFQLYSKYYDLLYTTKDYKAEAGYVNNSLRIFNKNIISMLELGSGTGNHALHLCAQGFEVHGIERSNEMVKVAKNKNIQNYYPRLADITSFKLEQKFDGAISLFHVISYLTDNEQLINCFTCTREHLKENGIFLFDVWYTPAVYLQKPEIRIKK
jgi:SAM-dependent methyltransferase